MEELKALSGIGQVLAGAGSLGILAFLIVWATKWFPQQSERVAKEREAMMASMAKEREAMLASMAEERKSMMETMHRDRNNNAQSLTLLAGAHEKAIEHMMRNVSEEARLERAECNRRHEDLMGRHDALIERLDKQHEEAMVQARESHTVVRTINHTVANIAQVRAGDVALREHASRDEEARSRKDDEGRSRPRGPRQSPPHGAQGGEV